MKFFDLFKLSAAHSSSLAVPPRERATAVEVPEIVYDTVDAPKYQASVLGLMDAVRPWFDCDPQQLLKLRLVVAFKKGLNGDKFYVNVPIRIAVRDTTCRIPSVALVASKFEAQEDLYALGQTVVKLDGEALGLNLRSFSGGIQHLGPGDYLSTSHTLTVNGD